jgi:hypothetical protein
VQSFPLFINVRPTTGNTRIKITFQCHIKVTCFSVTNNVSGAASPVWFIGFFDGIDNANANGIYVQSRSSNLASARNMYSIQYTSSAGSNGTPNVINSSNLGGVFYESPWTKQFFIWNGGNTVNNDYLLSIVYVF